MNKNTQFVQNKLIKPLIKVIANFTGEVRNDKMGGRDYLVAPMIMVVEGVLNANCGPLYYSAAEIRKSVASWNSKPVVLNHPDDNGMLTTACTPQFITEQGLGVIMNTKWQGGKLKAEAWLEVDQVNRVDNRVLAAVRDNKMMEVSTGLTCDVEEVDGEFDGVPYSGIVSNFRPDHLAILPDDVGACSINDGAGFLRLNKRNDALVIDITKMDVKDRGLLVGHKESILAQLSDVISNVLSHDSIRELLWSVLQDIDGDAWIESVYDGFFIYVKDGEYVRQGFSVLDNKIELVGSPEKVKKVVEFRKLDGTVIVTNRKETEMNKKKIVDDLIANTHTKFTEEDREVLMAMDDVVLNKMIPEPVANEEDDTEETAATSEQEEEVVQNKDKEQTTQEYIDKAPPDVRDMLQNGLNTHNAEKAEVIKLLLANDRNTFTKEQLESKQLDELHQLANLAANTQEKKDELAQTKTRAANYTGQAGASQQSVGNSEEEPMVIPVINFAEEQKKKMAS